VTAAAISVWGTGRVGMHLAPRGDAHAMGGSDPAATFLQVARELGRRGIVFLCAREYVGDDWLGPRLRQGFGGVYIANERFIGETAQQVLAWGEADAVAFGVLFSANPDPTTFYASGPEGYTDYPALDEGGYAAA
jgi:2,4-dienoyl-CoA reductase-like NADH-dependent reductase (Old Yellow Enzyme family)